MPRLIILGSKRGTPHDKTSRLIVWEPRVIVGVGSTSIGGGGIRYMLVYPPESANSAYAQLLIRVDDYRLIDGLMASESSP